MPTNQTANPHWVDGADPDLVVKNLERVIALAK